MSKQTGNQLCPPAKAIFFDLGSTLWNDYPALLDLWKNLSVILPKYDIYTTFEEIIEESKAVIATYSPSLTRSIIFKIVDGDLYRLRLIVGELIDGFINKYDDPEQFKKYNPIFPGVHELLDQLADDYILAVVSQNFARAETWMGFHELTRYFKQITLSSKERIWKPDPRLLLITCESVGVEPHQAVMVGDRLDNDIWPANRIGMTSVRVLADPYRIQQPRYHQDVPDFTIDNIADLPTILEP